MRGRIDVLYALYMDRDYEILFQTALSFVYLSYILRVSFVYLLCLSRSCLDIVSVYDALKMVDQNVYVVLKKIDQVIP